MIEMILIILIFVALLFVFLPDDIAIGLLLTATFLAPFFWMNQSWSAYQKREYARLRNSPAPDKRDMYRTLLKTLVRGGVWGLSFLLSLLALSHFDALAGLQPIPKINELLRYLWVVVGFSVCSGLFFWVSIVSTVRGW